MYCKSCGAELPLGNETNCSNCGQPVEDAPQGQKYDMKARAEIAVRGMRFFLLWGCL